MPVYTFGVDGAVLSADLMLPLQGMGVSLEMEPEVGPIIDNPIRTMKDVEALRVLDAQETVPFVLETVRLVRRELAGKQAVISFSGAPFPLACYMIEGRPSPNDELAKSLMYGQPGVWQALMDKLTAVVSNSLLAQLKVGPTLSEAHLCSHEGGRFALSPLWHGHGSRVRGDDRGRWRRDPCGLAR